MLTIYVDADACPVKDEVLKVAERYDLDVFLVSNSWLRVAPNPKVHMIQVEAGADVADDWIAERAQEGDVVVTADILLAGRCLENAVSVLNPNGKVFNENNIGNAIAGRAISQHMREANQSQSFNPAFSKQDRSRFLQSLDGAIQAIKRQ